MRRLRDKPTDRADIERLDRLERCQRDLWFLLTEVMGREFSEEAAAGLTLRMHRPVTRWFDRYRDESKLGVWFRRGWHKTTILVGLLVQEVLRDPFRSHYYFGGSPQLVGSVTSDLEYQFGRNDALRALDPVGVDPRTGKAFRIFPVKGRKFSTYQQSSGSIKLLRPWSNSRARTVELMTAATEGTGTHVDGLGVFDDIIGRNTVERSGLSGVEDWVTSTAYNLVDSKRFRSAATPWSDQSIHQKWMGDKAWRTLIVPGAIEESDAEYEARLASGDRKVHFAPSYAFTNPTFWPVEWTERARERLTMEQHDSAGNFAPQIMCDPEPAAERFWAADCEHLTGIQPTPTTPGVLGQGVSFVLSDPAPWLQGGYKGLSEKQRGDGTKDYWSIQVWKLRVRGDLTDAILLDGVRSQEWQPYQGCDEAARLMKKWKSHLFFSENADQWHQEMIAACQRANTSLRRARDGGPLKFDEYNKADGKNARVGLLAAKAKLGEVWICSESVPKEFLYGDSEHTGLLTQLRKWRRIGMNKNNLRFDDDADCAARVTDTALREFAPRSEALRQREWESMFEQNEAEAAAMRSRYCGM